MTAPILHGGGVAQAVQRFGGRPEMWLDLSTGINPCPAVLPSIPDGVWQRLPDRHRLEAACSAAAVFYGSGPIVPLAVPGTQSAIQCLPRLVARNARIAVLGPTYAEYARVFRLSGHVVDEIGDLAEVTGDHALVVVVNPNNPTGRIVPRADVLAIADRLAARGASLVIDEAFADCTPDISVVPDICGHENLIVFRSFGKFFGLAGLRLGFVAAAQPVADLFAEALGPWAVSGPALFLAEMLLAGDAVGIRQSIAARKAALDAVLRGAGLAIVGGASLFTLVETDAASALHETLCRQYVLTRAFSYAPSWLRVGLTPDEAADRRLADALRQAAI